MIAEEHLIEYRPIGVIRSPFKDVRGVPIQPRAASGVEGVVEVFSQYVDGLKDLDGFSHILLIYHFHLVEGYSLLVKPYMDRVE
ncbi:MAG TPA: tRNA (N6-threonylcarbamoyladenosine(37)-N6)-methyltransferase TrmO, partial [Nitrososphaeria archaeon]|nr:tRNA (N6-threonylcarbamoyladenosine(37)-N6)-methyltransferase TrmO [Nitrososphaeria archaeon]